MRADHDYFDDIDDVGYRGMPKLRQMITEQRLRKHRVKIGYGLGPKDEWDEDWESYDDYDDNEYADYNEDEFDSFSGVTRY